MTTAEFADQPAHWVLAEMGKRVLRPGGQELTNAMVDELGIDTTTDIIEFAPGTGATAERILAFDPQSYTAVELDADAAQSLRDQLTDPRCRVVTGNAAATELPTNSADAVYGEAMLTMHPDEGKAEIIGEANRLLRPGGRYGIHELGLVEDAVDQSIKAQLLEDLAAVTKVNARPLTTAEWTRILEQEGLTVEWQATAPMHLLEPTRVLQDEGILRTLQIGMNLLQHPAARSRVKDMRRVFRKYEEQLCAVSLVARVDDTATDQA